MFAVVNLQQVVFLNCCVLMFPVSEQRIAGMVFVTRPPVLMQFWRQRYVEKVETVGLGRTQISWREVARRSWLCEASA